MNASFMRKKRKEYVSRSEEETCASPWPGILLRGVGTFVGATVLLSLLMTGIAYVQPDPSRFLFLGTACPYIAAILSGVVVVRSSSDRGLLYAVLCGILSTALLWLFSAGFPSEGDSHAMGSLLKHAAVVAVCAAGGVLGRFKPAVNPRRHRPRVRR